LALLSVRLMEGLSPELTAQMTSRHTLQRFVLHVPAGLVRGLSGTRISANESV
jgi:hypothetical protein